MNKEELLAYTYSYLSYLFRGKLLPVERIILFGSVARGDFDEDSDIDLFIEAEHRNEKTLEKAAEKALGRFYNIEREKWRLKGVKNQISLKVGKLEEWELKSSVERDGVLLYASASSPKFKKHLLFTLEPITPLKKRMRVTRAIFGRKELGYQDEGLVLKYAGEVLNPRTFVVSADGLKEITAFLANQRVKYRFEEIWK